MGRPVPSTGRREDRPERNNTMLWLPVAGLLLLLLLTPLGFARTD
ncbi:MAG: hypothetical protein QOH61_2724 [Chloroflexota bacterium]|jgi:hypothetical protein|nr:hypothetical protein [Chloroflexota bacterium]